MSDRDQPPRPIDDDEESVAELRSIIGISDGVEVRIGQALWAQWFDIALQHDGEARAARAAVVAQFHHDLPFAPDLTREMSSALVTVAASAHGLDALYGHLRVDRPPAQQPREGAKREAHVRELLKYRFVNEGARNTRWETEFRWLFDLRDAAVHARYELASTRPHPSGVTYAGSVAVDYSAESAMRALDLLAEVLVLCVTEPKPTDRDAVEWASQYAPAVQGMLTRLRVSREIQPLVHHEPNEP